MTWKYSKEQLAQCSDEQLHELAVAADQQYAKFLTDNPNAEVTNPAGFFKVHLERENVMKEVDRRAKLETSSPITSGEKQLIVENPKDGAVEKVLTELSTPVPQSPLPVKARQKFGLNASDWLALVAILISLGIGFFNWRQTQRQFELINRPRLQLINVGFADRTFQTLPVRVIYQLENLGNFPAQITHGRLGWTLADPHDPAPWTRYEKATITTIQEFSVSKERPYSSQLMLTGVDSMFLFILRSVQNPFYIFGEYYYYDQVSEQDMVYKMAIQVKPDGTFDPKLGTNEPLNR